MNTSPRSIVKQCSEMILLSTILLLGLGLFQTVKASSIDLTFTEYDQLLQKHVIWLEGDKASVVDYAGLAKDQNTLNALLSRWSSFTEAEFNGLSKQDQMAFLINAYNGFTLQLILTRYPDLESIKDLGSLFSSPWKKKFFTLLGEKRHLDWIEHEKLRRTYPDPRIHAAVNCASIGCPALLNRAFTGKKLEQQLEMSIKRFLSNRSRNRVQNGELQVSQIFKWFSEDFEKGFRNTKSLKAFFGLYAQSLSSDPQVQQQIQAGQLPISHLKYDWGLNNPQK